MKRTISILLIALTLAIILTLSFATQVNSQEQSALSLYIRNYNRGKVKRFANKKRKNTRINRYLNASGKRRKGLRRFGKKRIIRKKIDVYGKKRRLNKKRVDTYRKKSRKVVKNKNVDLYKRK